MKKITEITGVNINDINKKYDVAGWRESEEGTAYPVWTLVASHPDNHTQDLLSLNLGSHSDISKWGNLKNIFTAVVEENPGLIVQLQAFCRCERSTDINGRVHLNRYSDYYLTDGTDNASESIFNGRKLADSVLTDVEFVYPPKL